MNALITLALQSMWTGFWTAMGAGIAFGVAVNYFLKHLKSGKKKAKRHIQWIIRGKKV